MTTQEKTLELAVVCFLFNRETQSLGLSLKKQHICEGRLMGYGGGIMQNETPQEAALRELQEECGVSGSIEDLEWLASINHHNYDTHNKEQYNCLIHFFRLCKWDGEPKTTDEMGPLKWYPVDSLPWNKMPVADKDWLPFALTGHSVTGHVHIRNKQSEIVFPTHRSFTDKPPF